MNRRTVLPIVLMLFFVSCELNPPIEPIDDYLYQTTRCFNFITVNETLLPISLTRDGSSKIMSLDYSYNKNMSSAYPEKDSLGESHPIYNVYDDKEKLIYRLNGTVDNKKEYTLFSIGEYQNSSDRLTSGILVESQNTLLADSTCGLRFGHFHPLYDSMYYYLNGKLLAKLAFGEMSESVNVIPNENDSFQIVTSLYTDGLPYYSQQNSKIVPLISNYFLLCAPLQQNDYSSNGLLKIKELLY